MKNVHKENNNIYKETINNDKQSPMEQECKVKKEDVIKEGRKYAV